MTLRKLEDTVKLKEEALHCTLWRTRYGRGYGSVVGQRNEYLNSADNRRYRGFYGVGIFMFPLFTLHPEPTAGGMLLID
jgi:hypothetical protein